MRPPFVRRCNGGPQGPWCGAHATVVVTADGLQWFACDEHRDRGCMEPIDVFFARVWKWPIADVRFELERGRRQEEHNGV